VDHFERLCAHPQSDQAALIRQGKELYGELVAPIESLVSWTGDLTIEPDDAMTGLAFEALSDRAGHYLGEKTPLTVSLGAYYEHKSRQALPITPNLPALVVAIRSSSVLPELSLPPLPDAQAEGEGVAFRFRNAHLLTGSDASEKAVLTALSDSSVFHFSGHALSSPKRSGLLLSKSLLKASALDASRVSDLQLAVLSACASEGGSNGTLTDGDSLVRTLLSRGVPHVVASRWEVDSRTTSRFMALFYEKVLSGDSVPKAIRKAQASLRADPETAHPFYWCAFGAFGRD
jgi:CHAT domain-containing protein